ncbi:MAG: long-chain fatty acid transporter [Sulfurovum sp.]|nr:MAG: long-chain fatty acid transporter [Sulfurovum sp.]
MGKIVKILALSAIASSMVMAGGYKIPEQSLNSMALGAAYVAHTMGADTAYFNPANMAFMNADTSYVDAALTLVNLPSIHYSLQFPVSGKSETENILIPTLHYVAPVIEDYEAFRWGVSLVVPGGLTKRWETPFQKATAEEFTLKVIELNPSMSYKINEDFSVGAGLRMIYSEGVVKSNSAYANAIDPRVPSAARDMHGDTIAFGYNLALTYKPTSDIILAATYRSNVDLKEEGTAKIYAAPYGLLYDGDASVEVPLPAALNLAVSKTWNDQFTVEFNYERTFWSTYDTLDFDYTGFGSWYVPAAFDAPIPKNWNDTNTYRVGATIKMDNKITAMFGFAIDDTPVPQNTIGFELPDSDAKIASIGFRYQQTKDLSWGAAFLYDSKESFSLTRGAHLDQSSLLNNGGTFSKGGAFLTTLGMSYEY